MLLSHNKYYDVLAEIAMQYLHYNLVQFVNYYLVVQTLKQLASNNDQPQKENSPFRHCV